jgi:hypothetical protein
VPQPPIKRLLADASLAFAGSVKAVGEGTVSGVAPDERTVVVEVGEVLHGSPGVGIPTGSRVTVQLSPDLPPLGVDDEATFFANGWLYGDSLAVTEVGRAPVEETVAPTARLAGFESPVSPVQVALAELADEELIAHANEADAAVRGHVIALNHVPQEAPLREHDPDWWVATLEIDLLVRGELPGVDDKGGTVPVLYANSLDVSWRDAPKPKAGQGGLWLLHRSPGELAELAPFQLIHPIDLQPSINIDLLRENQP